MVLSRMSILSETYSPFEKLFYHHELTWKTRGCICAWYDVREAEGALLICRVRRLPEGQLKILYVRAEGSLDILPF